jgi:hypothetical protein
MCDSEIGGDREKDVLDKEEIFRRTRVTKPGRRVKVR